ncbi:DEAD/DEAH box helicase [Corynebacterium sp. zg254]|uniref:DEAD/DEAH box helicase n=2 Tax=Corynebacteriaceae TaxID=1653 RepID=A0ABQ6VHN2_9CORY|nr:DEAD/DEAH box helicase [Corynebacterium zhongnanshanii]MCR5914301.1 DEAD/DEAH box helicase [Corynebacterium sp. zg254]
MFLPNCWRISEIPCGGGDVVHLATFDRATSQLRRTQVPDFSPASPPRQPSHFGDELLQELQAHMKNSTLTHVRHEPARPSQPVDWPQWTHPDLVAYLQESGINRPWSHQAQTADLAFHGQDVIVSTGTSSGKSLAYQLPILSVLGQKNSTATALYISPTKALAQDQRASIARLCRGAHDVTEAVDVGKKGNGKAQEADDLGSIMVATYDGDTPQDSRRVIREQARIIVTNPDMLHASIVGRPQAWTRLLKTVRFIVIDECHVYRGVFGAHVSMVLRRLLRLAHAQPTVILASATSVDPAAHARRLTGRTAISAVTKDGAPSGERTIALWEPGLLPDKKGEHGAPVRRAANTESAEIMGRIIAQGARTLSFVRSRRGAEHVAMGAAEQLSSLGRSQDAVRVAAYRAGYTPEDRRDLERRLDNGELLGVASTNALELGIDVGGLDVVVTSGFPGTVASFRQQAGRAGRRGQGALVVLVGADDPMDTYLVHHPEALLDRPVENTVFDPSNPYVLADHLVCAAAEKPLAWEEIEAWGATRVAEFLLRKGLLRRRPRGIFADVEAAKSIHGSVSIRGGAAKQVAIVDSSTGRLLGTVDSSRAISDVHTGAVYVHQAETYVVEQLDLQENVAWVKESMPEYSTSVNKETDIRVLTTRSTIKLDEGVWLADVDVEVSHQVTSYQKRLPDGEVLDVVPLDVPPESLRTRAVAYTIDPWVLEDLGLPEPVWPGTLHAAEHAAIGLLPLTATCDRWDIGGVSTVLHADTGLPTVFVYDGYTGGAGFAEQGFRKFSSWIRATRDAVAACECESGCPSCVQSPKCGNGNDPLFKSGALVLLSYLADVAE